MHTPENYTGEQINGTFQQATQETKAVPRRTVERRVISPYIIIMNIYYIKYSAL
jgi:hypothetical protein